MKRTVVLLTAALLAAGFAPANAHSVSCVGQRGRSIFGTVARVNGRVITLHTNAPTGDIDVYMPDNDVHRVGGVTLRPGVFAGVFGCLPPNSSDFTSEIVTISSSEETYPTQYRYAADRDEIYGRVDQVGMGRILVRGTARKDTWVITKQNGFATGQTVRAIGYYEPNGTFVATDVALARP